MIDLALIYNSLPNLLNGVLLTLTIALSSTFIGLSFGTMLALVHNSRNKLFARLVTIYVHIIRGTPMLIQIFFVFYVLPQFGIIIPALASAILAIGLNSSAYVSQVIRSGITSIGKGQREAAQVLGFSSMQITRYIILPQAFRVIFPALGNELTTLIKDSSLASIIGVMELTKEGNIIRSRTYDAVTVLFAVTILYLLITSTVSCFMNWLEQRMNHHASH